MMEAEEEAILDRGIEIGKKQFLKWLEKWCTGHSEFINSPDDDIAHRYVQLRALFSAARKEAGVEEDE